MSPNVVTFNTVINACGKAGRAADAEAVLASMDEHGLQPDKVSFTALVDAYGRAGEVEMVRGRDCLVSWPSHLSLRGAFSALYPLPSSSRLPSLVFPVVCFLGELSILQGWQHRILPDRWRFDFISLS